MSADRRFSKPLPLPTGGSHQRRTGVERPASLTPPAVSPDDGGRLWITSPRPPLALVRLVQRKKAHDGQAHDVLHPPTQPTKTPIDSAHGRASGSTHQTPSGSVHRTPSGSTHQTPRGSVHRTLSGSAHQRPLGSAHQMRQLMR